MNQQRLERLRATLPKLRADGLLVSALPNIRYLTGFTGSNALLVVTADDALLYTDGRYKTQAKQEVAGARVIVPKAALNRVLMRSIRQRRLRRLGFETTKVSFDFYRMLRVGLPGCRLVPTSGTVEKLRAIKSPEEIEAIRRSVKLNSAVFEVAVRRIRAGQSELEIARRIDSEMWRQGAEKAAFETIVLTGERTALPHGRPSRNPVNESELILIDQGVILAGYASDMTRMAALRGPGRKARGLHQVVLEAQQAAVSAVRAGVPACLVDGAARRVLDRYGLEKAFVHSTGHGVGLEIHEAPRLAPKEKARLEAGMVVTIEPGAYLEGVGGVRIEDMVLVTDRGCEVLTPTPKDLRVL